MPQSVAGCTTFCGLCCRYMDNVCAIVVVTVVVVPPCIPIKRWHVAYLPAFAGLISSFASAPSVFVWLSQLSGLSNGRDWSNGWFDERSVDLSVGCPVCASLLCDFWQEQQLRKDELITQLTNNNSENNN